MNVIKRDGKSEPLDYEKINQVAIYATDGINNVNASDVIMEAKIQLYDGITTTEIHNTLVRAASNMISEETPNYQWVAAKLLNYYLRKNIFNSSGENLPHIKDVIKTNVELGVYDKGLLDYTDDELSKINGFIKHQRDNKFSYAGIQQMVDKYLLKNRKTNELYETPQYAYMCIAMTVAQSHPDRLKQIKRLYDSYSNHEISLPTPIMAGVRTPNRQYSSCTIIDVGDTLESIAASQHAVLRYSSKRAGIGLNMGRIRGIGSLIRGGEVIHTGFIPYAKTMESIVKSCIQGGIRGGGATVSVPWWHTEIMDITVLKNNTGTDENRVRKLDYTIQMNRLIYRRFLADEEISLFSPHLMSGELYDTFISGDNDKFEELYISMEKDLSIERKTVKARDLMNLIAMERLGTGRIYINNVDHFNTHSAFIPASTSSNLCLEVNLLQSPLKHIDDEDGEIALCVLGGFNLGVIKTHEDLERIAELIVYTLDFVTEHQDYPVKAAEKQLKRRNIGVGVTNFAYYLAKRGLHYNDKEALEEVDKLFESIQYYLLKASNKLAKELGKCEYFEDTKYSKGILPIDTYNKNVDSLVNRKYTHDWESLRNEILLHGLRNSTLTAMMPVESSSLVTNSTNGIDPIIALVTGKVSKQGIIRVVAPESTKLKNKYTKAWELGDNTGMINIQAVITKWIDQAISSNTYYDYESFDDGEIPLSVIIKDILYSYKMGLKTMYYARSNDGSSKDDLSKEDERTENTQPESNETLVTTNNVSSDIYIEDDMGCAGGSCSL